MKRKYILASIFVLLISVLFIYKGLNLSKELPNQTVQQNVAEKTFKLKVDFGDNNIKSYETKTNAETTAFSILRDQLVKDSIALETVQYDFGIFVKKIGDLESTAKKSWIYYLNGESGQVAADTQILKDGDLVEWKYETPKI